MIISSSLSGGSGGNMWIPPAQFIDNGLAGTAVRAAHVGCDSWLLPNAADSAIVTSFIPPKTGTGSWTAYIIYFADGSGNFRVKQHYEPMADGVVLTDTYASSDLVTLPGSATADTNLNFAPAGWLDWVPSTPYEMMRYKIERLGSDGADTGTDLRVIGVLLVPHP